MNAKLQDPNHLICAFCKAEVSLSPHPSVQQRKEYPLKETQSVFSACVSPLEWETRLWHPSMMDSALPHLIWFLPVAEGLPHGHAVTPYITLAGELVIEDALRSIPFQGPFARCPGLEQSKEEHLHPETQTALS